MVGAAVGSTSDPGAMAGQTVAASTTTIAGEMGAGEMGAGAMGAGAMAGAVLSTPDDETSIYR
jgi:hypothetical protein